MARKAGRASPVRAQLILAAFIIMRLQQRKQGVTDEQQARQKRGDETHIEAAGVTFRT